MLTSNLIKNGAMLQNPAGGNAINANDLLLINAVGKLYPVAVSDAAAVGNAGTALIATTTLAALNLTTMSRKEVFVSPTDGGVYVAYPYQASNCGLTVNKYTSAGGLVASVIVESTANSQLNGPCIQQLSNGNILITWCTAIGGVPGVYFAVYDQVLIPVVAKTLISAANNTTYFDSIPLSAGFAVAYPTATGIFLAIYTNAGGVTYAGAAITGSPTIGGAVRLAQLSNGNIALAINSSASGNALAHAVSTVAGAAVVNYTILDAATSAGSKFPEIVAAAGFYACSIADGINIVCAVLNNAGALQGAPYSAANTNVDGTIAKFSKLMTDGSVFWLAYSPSSGGPAITYVPTAGVGYVTTAVTAANFSDAFLDRGILVIAGTASTHYPFQVNVTGSVSTLPTVTATIGGACTVKPAGDFCFAAFSSFSGGPSMTLTAYKYMNTAIVGVAQAALAAGNSGTLVPYAMGPGGYPCNAIAGTLGKAFDHTATNIIGNKGVILGSSASLRGI